MSRANKEIHATVAKGELSPASLTDLAVVRALLPLLEACGVLSHHRDSRFGLGMWDSASASRGLHPRPHSSLL